MANLTISLDEDIIRGARVRAIQEGTSMSAKVREFLAQYAQNTNAPGNEVQRKAGEAILAMARARQTASRESLEEPRSEGTSENFKFNRDEANDRYPTWPPARHPSPKP